MSPGLGVHDVADFHRSVQVGDVRLVLVAEIVTILVVQRTQQGCCSLRRAGDH